MISTSATATSDSLTLIDALTAPDGDRVEDARARTVFRAGAIYDLVVTLPFAVPPVAVLTLGLFRRLHGALGLGGSPLPDFAPTHLLFVAFFGTVVSFWSFLRLSTLSRRVHAYDTLGRFVFSALQIWALANGASALLVPFLIIELGFGFAQARAVKKP